MSDFQQERRRRKEAEEQIGILRSLLERQDAFYESERKRLTVRVREADGRNRFAEARIEALSGELAALKRSSFAGRLRRAVKIILGPPSEVVRVFRVSGITSETQEGQKRSKAA